MNDIVKLYREKHPWLDFIAGFIPGVGEALDILDFAHAVKDKNWLIAGTSLLGLALPGVTGGQATKLIKAAKKHLPDSLKSKGWKEIDGRIFDPKGEEYIYNSEGRLNPAKSFKETLALLDKASELKDKAKKDALKLRLKILKFNKQADLFGERTGFYSFNTEAWQAGIPKSARLTSDQLLLYIDKGAPAIMKHYDTLIENGKKAKPLYPALRRTEDGRYQAYYQTSLPLKGTWALKYAAGWRDVTNLEAELYLIETLPNAAGKFVLTGIPMYRGISAVMIPEFLSYSRVLPWYSSNISNASHYTGNNGLAFFAAPIKTPNTKVEIIRQSRPASTLQHWRTDAISDSMSGYSTGGRGTINISEIPVADEMVKGLPIAQTKGFATFLGDEVRVKALKGGTGLFDLSQMNPLLHNGGRLIQKKK